MALGGDIRNQKAGDELRVLLLIHAHLVSGFGVGVSGFGFRVSGSGFRV